MFGGAGIGSMKYSFLRERNLPDDCRAKYAESVKRLKKERVDVFIGNHVWNNDTKGKIEKMGKTDRNPFVDPDEWQRFLDEKLGELNELIENDLS
jgi:metallo-beta-lactamase class B